MSNDWIQLSINNPGQITEAISNFLFEQGAQGVVDNDNRLDAYFEDNISQKDLLKAIQNYIKELGLLGFDIINCTVEFQSIKDRDWNAEWKKYYKSVHVSENILIKPSWEQFPAQPPKCLIEIDPGMAFGTGTHETTKLVLQLLEKNIQSNDNILDVGTGTGILAIAAIKLGAEKVLAFDVDPLATEATVENATKNNVLEKINVFIGNLSNVKKSTFDVIMANVNRTEIVKMLPFITAYMHEKSRLLLSGILAEEKEIITDGLNNQNLKIQEILQMGEWIAIHAQK